MAEVRAHRGHPAREGRGREPAARISASQRSRSSTVASPTLPAAKRGEEAEVAAVGVDGARRAPGCEEQQVALEVGVGGQVTAPDRFGGSALRSFATGQDRGCERS